MIEIIDLRKSFGEKIVTNGINLKVSKGKSVCVIGGSGEGKSILLKQIVGLIKPTSGSIIIDGHDVAQAEDDQLKEIRKKFGYVFQFAALLDSMTILENISLPLIEQGIEQEKAFAVAKEKISLVNLNEEVLYKHPCEISGGMQKRVGIARTLVTNPEIILFDEPTSGLDPITTRIVHELILKLQDQLNITSIIISHDVEIFNYVNYVAFLYKGTISHFGPAKEIWNSQNPFLYQFIRGLTNGPIELEAKFINQTTGEI